MASTKANIPDSQLEGLQNILPDIAAVMAAPDADMKFLAQLQAVVLAKIREGNKPTGPGGPPGAGGPPAGPGGPPGPGGAAPGGAPAGMGMAGGPPGGGAPNGAMQGGGAPEAPTQPGGVSKPMGLPADEVRRVLAQQAGA